MTKAEKINPIRPTDDEARALGRSLMEDAQFAALGVLEPQTGMPLVSRVAVAVEEDASPFMLISDLSAHSMALREDGRASLLFGEPGTKGDPLTHPRITVIGHFECLPRDDKSYEARRSFWLKKHPKSKIYIDFGDFNYWKMNIQGANLNGGFGKAFQLRPDDLLCVAN